MDNLSSSSLVPMNLDLTLMHEYLITICVYKVFGEMLERAFIHDT